jgi:hypothetical protein
VRRTRRIPFICVPGPMLNHPLYVSVGETVVRDQFALVDLMACSPPNYHPPGHFHFRFRYGHTATQPEPTLLTLGDKAGVPAKGRTNSDLTTTLESSSVQRHKHDLLLNRLSLTKTRAGPIRCAALPREISS